MVVQGQRTTRRAEAEARLRSALAALVDEGGAPDGVAVEVGSLGGFPVSATVQRRMSVESILLLALDGVPDSEVRLTTGQLGDTAVVTRLENRLTGLERLRDETAAKIDRLRAELARAGDLLGKPFPHAEKLTAARSRVREIAEELEKIANRRPDGQPEAADGAAEPAPSGDARRDQRQEWARHAPAAAPPTTVPPRAGRPAGAVAP
jgi:hypothetical protein